MPAARLMRPGVPPPPDASIDTLVHEHILGSDDRAFPVVEGDRFVGLVCLDDVRKAPREAWPTTTVAAVTMPAERLAVMGPRDILKWLQLHAEQARL